MSDGFDIDTRELTALAVSIGRAPGAVIAASRPVVEKALLNIKTETRADLSDHPSWKRLASTVNYDVTGLDGEVGYDDQGQGELAGIYEFGSATRGPHPTLFPAADREAPRFEAALAAVAVKVTEATL